MRRYIDYIKESKSEEYFDTIFSKITTFSSNLKNSFESSLEINKRTEITQPQPQAQKVKPQAQKEPQTQKVQTQTQKEKVDNHGNPVKVGNQYIYKNNIVIVRSLDSNVPGKVTAERLSKNGKPMGTTFDAVPEELSSRSNPKKEVTIA